jgi:lipopolysaccharide transport system ATP-binding protein
MSQSAITLDRLGKSYRLGVIPNSKKTMREAVTDLVAGPFRRAMRFGEAAQQVEPFWALKDVSFDIKPGEAIGLIGRNGAGKSTLLKILSRITDPSTGSAKLRGRVASLLEVGTGFHPDLTGRENIYLNGSILGMRRSEINRKFDEIVEFSEVSKFLDTPVKRFSSGMYVRLAFGVAAHLEPDILLCDEVLAVGDMAFQEKCLGKMNGVINEGRTVVFVSHNMSSVSALTKRCLLFQKGRLTLDAPTDEAIRAFVEMSLAGTAVGDAYKAEEPRDPDSNYMAEARVITSGASGIHEFGEPLAFEFILHIGTPRDSLSFVFDVIDSLGRPITQMLLADSSVPFRQARGDYRIRFEVPRSRLYQGRYMLNTQLIEKSASFIQDSQTEICPFEVSMGSFTRSYFEWEKGMCTYIEDGDWAPVVELETV